MGQIKIFLDTNVVISSLLSQKGASYELISASKVKKQISVAVEREIREVSYRKEIDQKEINLILKKVQLTSLKVTKLKIISSFSVYVFDQEDSHIVAGAYLTKSKFLITYNIKHFNSEKIKTDLGIIVIKPGNFLQYLRSLN